jgi:hypothetical protein
LTSAADRFGVKEQIEDLLALAKGLRKENISVRESNLGPEFFSMLDKAGIPHSRALEVLKALRSALACDDPTTVFATADKMMKAAKETGLPFPDLVVDYDKKVREFKTLQEDERHKTDEHEKQAEVKLQAKTKSEEDKVARASEELKEVERKTSEGKAQLGKLETKITEAKAILAEADDIRRAKADLTEFGAKNPPLAAKILAEVEALGSDPRRLAYAIDKFGKLEGAIDDARRELSGERKALSSLRLVIKDEQKKLSGIDVGIARARARKNAYRRGVRLEKTRLRAQLKKTARAEKVDADLRTLRETVRVRRRGLGKLETQIGRADVDAAELERDLGDLKVELDKTTAKAAALIRVEATFDKIKEGLRRARSECRNEEKAMRSCLKEKEARIGKTIERKEIRLSELSSLERSEKKRIQGEIDAENTELAAVTNEKAEFERAIEVINSTLDQIEGRLSKYGPLSGLAQIMSGRPIDLRSYAKLADALLAGVAAHLSSEPSRPGLGSSYLLSQIRSVQKELRRLAEGGK